MEVQNILQNSVTGNKVWRWKKGIECRGCGEVLELLTHVHVAKHGLTQEEYCIDNPDQSYTFCWGDEPGKLADKKFAGFREQSKRRVKNA